MEHVIEHMPDQIPGIIAVVLIMAVVGMAGALAVLWRSYVKVRDKNDTQGKDFLQMFAEAQSDAFAQIKESEKTLTSLVAALGGVKEQGERVERRLESLETKKG